MTIAGSSFFHNKNYLFEVVAYDLLSNTTDTKQCYMYSATSSEASKNQVIDLKLVSEANNNGFLDFKNTYNSFKVSIYNTMGVNMSNA